MKIYVWLIAIAVMGYSSGILLESLAYGEDSKIQSLLQTGTITQQWIPFGIGLELSKSNTFSTSVPVAYDSMEFLKEGHLLFNDEILTDGYVDFVISVENVNKEFLANKVDICIFQSKENIPEASCVICELTDENFIKIASGETAVNGLMAFTPTVDIKIDTFEFPWANNVENVHGVRIKVCLPGEGDEGCTPGFWKNHNAFSQATDHWPAIGVDFNGAPINPLEEATLFVTVFNENPVLQMNWNGGTGTLLESLNAQGGGVNALARHGVGAYLNAISSVDFEFSPGQVITLVQIAFNGGTFGGMTFQSGDFEGVKDVLEAANVRGCPLGNDPIINNNEAPAFSETGGVDPTIYSGETITPYEKKQYAVMTLNNLINNPPTTLLPSTVTDLTFASTYLDETLDPDLYWVNDYHIGIINGQVVLDKTKDAVIALISVTNDVNEDQAVKDTVQIVIDELLAADLILAQTAIDDVVACGGKNAKIDSHLSSAQTKLTQAQQDTNDKKYDMALQKFYDAWFEAFLATTSCPDGYWTQLDGYTVLP